MQILFASCAGPQLDWLIKLVVGSLELVDEEEVGWLLLLPLVLHCASLF